MSEIEKEVKKAKPKLAAKVATVENNASEFTVRDAAQAEMLDLIKSMREEIDALKSGQKTSYTSQSGSRYIQVVCLHDGVLNLTTQDRGEGKRYSFKGFGTTQKILSGDLEDVVRVHHSFAIDGHFYIKDKAFVEEVGLAEDYKNILSKEQLLGIVNGEYGVDFTEIFKNAPDHQKYMIFNLAVQKVAEKNYEVAVIDKIEKLANNYVKVLNKARILREKGLPEHVKVDIIDKSRTDSKYDSNGNIIEDYEEEDEEE